MELTFQTWIDYAGTRLGISILVYCIYLMSTVYKFQLFLVWLLVVGYLVDYFLRYNMPIEGTVFSYTMFMTIAFGVIILMTFINET